MKQVNESIYAGSMHKRHQNNTKLQKIVTPIFTLALLLSGAFLVTNTNQAYAATMTPYATASQNSANLAYHMDEPLYTAIYNTYNNTGSPKLDADQDGVITTVEAGGWGGTTISLPSSNIDGTLRGIEFFTNIKILRLQSNKLSGEIPVNIGNISGLTDLRLNGNSLSGSIPNNIGNLSGLTYFSLNNNQLTGDIPSSISNLTGLKTLNFHSNSLSGSIPNGISSLASLEYLYLHFNELSGAIPDGITSLTALKELNLSYNNLDGSIPNGIGSLINLTYLNVSSNQLTGSIPSSISGLSKVKTLRAEGNKLTGTIPTTIGSLSTLTNLDLSVNQLTGSIPDSIGDLTSLASLSLYGNRLSGSIPSSIGSLTNLSTLYLSSNKLSGSIPASFAGLTSLTSISLGHNYQLAGTVPILASVTRFTAQYNLYTSLDLSGYTSLTSISADSNPLLALRTATALASGSGQETTGSLYDTGATDGTFVATGVVSWFDGSKVSNVVGGTFDPLTNTFTLADGLYQDVITYDYDADNGNVLHAQIKLTNNVYAPDVPSTGVGSINPTAASSVVLAVITALGLAGISRKFSRRTK